MCFRCLIFSLSGPRELLFLFFILDLSCGECNSISVYFLCCSICLVCCLSDSVCELFGCLVKQLAICLGVVVECYGSVSCG